MISSDEVIRIFEERDALLRGHFLLASGKHSDAFFQAARVIQYPQELVRLCGALADTFRDQNVDLVVGPATGGIPIAHEVARALGVRSAFSEHDGDTMAVRRGLRIEQGERAIVVDDVVTTGGSIMKTVKHLQARGCNVVGIGAFVFRGRMQDHPFGSEPPFHVLATIEVGSYQPADCPMCKSGVPLVDPDDLFA